MNAVEIAIYAAALATLLALDFVIVCAVWIVAEMSRPEPPAPEKVEKPLKPFKLELRNRKSNHYVFHNLQKNYIGKPSPTISYNVLVNGIFSNRHRNELWEGATLVEEPK